MITIEWSYKTIIFGVESAAALELSYKRLIVRFTQFITAIRQGPPPPPQHTHTEALFLQNDLRYLISLEVLN